MILHMLGMKEVCKTIWKEQKKTWQIAHKENIAKKNNGDSHFIIIREKQNTPNFISPS